MDVNETKAFQYLATEVARQRLVTVCQLVMSACGGDVDDIVVSEQRDEAGNQQIASFLLFTRAFGGALVEAKNPLSRDHFDITPLAPGVAWLDFVSTNFDFRKADENSRLTLQFHLESGIVGTVYASGMNCDEVLRFAKQWLFPRLSQADQAEIH